MIEFPIDKLIELCGKISVNVTPKMAGQFALYGELLIEWNERINLTAITEPEEIVIKHFYDCALTLKHCNLPEGADVIDVGTGAGFPGVVLKILRPDINLTLLDSLNKRIIFLNEVCNRLGIKANTIHARAEEAAAKEELRERFDIATARAVARLNVLCEYCMPFVKPGGTFLSLKGPQAADEISEAKRAVKLLGGAEPELFTENLRETEERNFILIKKISQTPPKYPRISAKIKKQPL